MEQLELFKSEVDESDLHEVDYIFEKEGDKYRLVHSFYNSSRKGELLTAEEALECMRFHNNWYHYSAVSFRDTMFLKKRSR